MGDHPQAANGARGRVLVQDDSFVVEATGRPVRHTGFEKRLSSASTHPDWFEALLADFDGALRDGSSHLAVLDEAESCARVIDAAYRPDAVPASG